MMNTIWNIAVILWNQPPIRTPTITTFVVPLRWPTFDLEIFSAVQFFFDELGSACVVPIHVLLEAHDRHRPERIRLKHVKDYEKHHCRTSWWTGHIQGKKKKVKRTPHDTWGVSLPCKYIESTSLFAETQYQSFLGLLHRPWLSPYLHKKISHIAQTVVLLAWARSLLTDLNHENIIRNLRTEKLTAKQNR